MGCGGSGLSAQERKKEERKREEEERKRKYAEEKADEWTQHWLKKVEGARTDCLEDHDWGLEDADVHRDEHLKCHDATVYNTVANAQNCLSTCDDAIKILEEAAQEAELVPTAAVTYAGAIGRTKAVRKEILEMLHDYAEYWANHEALPGSTRRTLVGVLTTRWSGEFTESQFEQMYEKFEAHVKACDAGVDEKWNKFRTDRDEMLAELYGALSERCDQLEPEFNKWKAEMASVECTDQRFCSNPDHSEHKRDRCVPGTSASWFSQEASGEKYCVKWDEHCMAEFNKLCVHVRHKIGQLYLQHYGALEETDQMDTICYVRLSPTLNFGEISEECTEVTEADAFVELTPDELRKYNGKFHSDEERLQYMTSTNQPRVDLETGGRSYQRVFTTVSAKNLLVRGLYRRSSEHGYNGLNLLVFPGGSCLDSLET